MAKEIAIVMGATSGLGRGMAERFGAGGYHVVINGRDKERAHEVLEAIQNAGGSAQVAIADVSTEAGVREVFDALDDGSLKVLINSAGGVVEESFDVNTIEDPTYTYAINTFSPYWATMMASQKMKTGSIINISSSHARTVIGSRIPHYGSSKAALTHMTRQLAVRLAPNIRVNAISPGRTLTPAWGDMSTKESDTMAAGQLINRWITVEEVADAAWFVAHNEAMTGADLVIDGGLEHGFKKDQ